MSVTRTGRRRQPNTPPIYCKSCGGLIKVGSYYVEAGTVIECDTCAGKNAAASKAGSGYVCMFGLVAFAASGYFAFNGNWPPAFYFLLVGGGLAT